ncbi:DUF7269 family protein [Halomarina rubra]|uniref:Uncharacterized protein n=1 Tax=Halomarina rubra TaxID=2071873 RepID=A0ABD6ATG2_9EURY|nr:hypothetical protein [Halomarina rubra]
MSLSRRLGALSALLDARTVLTAVAVLTLALAGLVVVAPDRFAVSTSLADTARPVVSIAAVFAGVLGLLFALRLTPSGVTEELDVEDESPVADREDPLGNTIDEALDGYADGNTWERLQARQIVVGRLTEAAVYVLTETEGWSESVARHRVEHGTWTDDQVTAAFLAADGEVILPLRTRLEEWLRGERFPRHARAVVAELAARSDRVRPPEPRLARQSSRGGERTARVRIRADGGER